MSAVGSRHVSTGTGLAPATSAPGLGSPLPRLHRDWGSPLPHLRRGLGLTAATSAPGTVAHLCHICTGTGAHRCHICTGTGAHRCHICTGTGAHLDEGADGWAPVVSVDLRSAAIPMAQWKPSSPSRPTSSPSPGADVTRGEPSPGADVTRGEPSPGADVAPVSPVPVQMWQRRAQSRCRCGSSAPSPGADVAAV